MVRRSLFLGLTGMLVVVLGYLVVQGRKQEKKQQENPLPVEVVKESKPTLTRVIAPSDLQVMEAKMEVAHTDGGLSAKHQIIVRNNGRSGYRNIRLRMTYVSRSEQALGSRTIQAAEILLAGQSRSLGEMLAKDVPAGTAKAAVTILSADFYAVPAAPK